jgi:hypothetical protein
MKKAYLGPDKQMHTAVYLEAPEHGVWVLEETDPNECPAQPELASRHQYYRLIDGPWFHRRLPAKGDTWRGEATPPAFEGFEVMASVSDHWEGLWQKMLDARISQRWDNLVSQSQNTMAKTFEYLVYRIGSNTANQSMCERAPVAIVRAANRAAATRTKVKAEHPSVYDCPELTPDGELVAHRANLDVWANQRLEAVPASRAPAADLNAVYEEDALREAASEDPTITP